MADTNKNSFLRVVVWFAAIILQLIMSQIVAFIFSMVVPDMENFPQENPPLFVLFLGISFSLGIFLAGWFFIKMGWLPLKPLYTTRYIGALVGAYLPLIIGLLLYHALEAGNPFFLVAIIASIFGFYFPGWVADKG